MAYKEDIARTNRDSLVQDPMMANMKPLITFIAGAQLLTPTIGYATSKIVFEEQTVAESVYGLTQKESAIQKALTQNQLREVEYESAIDEVLSIGTFGDNWDGYGAIQPSEIVVNNAMKFLKEMCRTGKKCPSLSDIQATPYGTIVIDLYDKHGLLSIEIARHMVGYFTDYKDSKALGSEGIETDFSSIPNELLQLMS